MFSEDGIVKIHREVFYPVYSAEKAESQADVTANYAVAPMFGRYEDFIQRERTAEFL